MVETDNAGEEEDNTPDEVKAERETAEKSQNEQLHNETHEDTQIVNDIVEEKQKEQSELSGGSSRSQNSRSHKNTLKKRVRPIGKIQTQKKKFVAPRSLKKTNLSEKDSETNVQNVLQQQWGLAS